MRVAVEDVAVHGHAVVAHLVRVRVRVRVRVS